MGKVTELNREYIQYVMCIYIYLYVYAMYMHYMICIVLTYVALPIDIDGEPGIALCMPVLWEMLDSGSRAGAEMREASAG